MSFEIILAPEAAKSLNKLMGRNRAWVRDALERYLRHAPRRVSKSRIKRLRGLDRPQYRLRVGQIRVFYDATETAVEVLAVITKEQAQAWLDEAGTRGS